MELADVQRLRSKCESVTKKVLLIDEVTGQPKKDSDGNVLYETRRAPMVIRLDNEHVIEESIIPFIWDDNTQTIMWWETPTRGNTYSIPTGSMGLTPEFPMMWSMTTYNEIQQISCIPTKDQAKTMFKAMLGDESRHDGTIKESSAIKIIDYYYNINSQAFQIINRNENPFDIVKVPEEAKAEPAINQDYAHTVENVNEMDTSAYGENIPFVAPPKGPSVPLPPAPSID